jgi:hypothetical protein
VPAKIVYFEQIKKLMGWCPLKDSLQKGRQGEFFSGFKSENGNLQLMPSSPNPQESRTLKARVSLFDDSWILWVLAVVFFTLIVSLLVWTYNSPEGSFLILFSGLIWFLIPLMFLLNRPNTVVSVKKNKDHSYRWLFRLFFITFILLFLSQIILNDLRILGGSATEYPDISNFLIQFAQVTFFLVLFYNGELVAPYQQVINITTRSNLKLRLYIDELEEIMAIIKTGLLMKPFT